MKEPTTHYFTADWHYTVIEGGINLNFFGRKINIGGKKVHKVMPNVRQSMTIYEWGFDSIGGEKDSAKK